MKKTFVPQPLGKKYFKKILFIFGCPKRKKKKKGIQSPGYRTVRGGRDYTLHPLTTPDRL